MACGSGTAPHLPPRRSVSPSPQARPQHREGGIVFQNGTGTLTATEGALLLTAETCGGSPACGATP